MTSGARAVDRARTILRDALEQLPTDDVARPVLSSHLERLDEPLRVALAGKVKAGKSTLLNALLGEQLAPTDAAECTRVVTWYRHGRAPRVTVHPWRGRPVPQPVRRLDGRLQLGTAGLAYPDVERIVVDWPSPLLEHLTLIDTPGMSSLSADVSAGARRFLVPEESTSEADAVVYLMRHLHSSDVDFLESFRDRQTVRAGPTTTLAVLSRADEIGAGRIDAMISASAAAARYRADDTVRSLCLDVVPVAGLLAQGARALREAEVDALRALASMDRADRERLLLSAERFVSADLPQLPHAGTAVRGGVLDRLGIFGIRLATALLRGGMKDSSALADELVRRSGMAEVASLLTAQFTVRAELLKARSALLAARQVCDGGHSERLSGVRAQVEQALADTHELVEMRWLAALRSPARPALPAEHGAEAQRILGGQGTAAATRLGQPPEVSLEQLRALAIDLVSTWRTRAANPLNDATAAEVCGVVVRSLEGVVADLPSALQAPPRPDLALATAPRGASVPEPSFAPKPPPDGG